MKLNTPTAIFLGLALIAAAIFFRQPSISEAQAGVFSGDSGKWIGWVAGDNSHIMNTKTKTVYWCFSRECRHIADLK